MKKQANPAETMMEAQNKLVETMSANAMKAMEIFRMEDTWSKKGRELMESYMKEQRELAEKMMQPATFEKGMEGVTEQMMHAMQVQWDYARKTMDFYRDAMMAMAEPKAENPFMRMFEIGNDTMHAMMDAMKKNMEAMRPAQWN
jgi:hypothetical protein